MDLSNSDFDGKMDTFEIQKKRLLSSKNCDELNRRKQDLDKKIINKAKVIRQFDFGNKQTQHQMESDFERKLIDRKNLRDTMKDCGC